MFISHLNQNYFVSSRMINSFRFQLNFLIFIDTEKLDTQVFNIMAESTPYDVSLSREKADELRTPTANATLPVPQSTTAKGKDTPAVRVSANNDLSSTPLPFRTLYYNELNASASSAPSQSQFSTNRAKVRSTLAKKSPPPPIDVMIANCYMSPGQKKDKEEKEVGDIRGSGDDLCTLWNSAPGFPFLFSCLFE